MKRSQGSRSSRRGRLRWRLKFYADSSRPSENKIEGPTNGRPGVWKGYRGEAMLAHKHAHRALKENEDKAAYARGSEGEHGASRQVQVTKKKGDKMTDRLYFQAKEHPCVEMAFRYIGNNDRECVVMIDGHVFSMSRNEFQQIRQRGYQVSVCETIDMAGESHIVICTVQDKS